MTAQAKRENVGSPDRAEFHVIIPARLASTRLPGKMLADVEGRPLILHTLHRARSSAARSIHVATDDEQIAAAVSRAGGDAVLTAPEHSSGTDRLVEAVTTLNFDDDAIIVNLQGDEPRMPTPCIEQVARLLQHQPSAQIATLWARIDCEKELARSKRRQAAFRPQRSSAVLFPSGHAVCPIGPLAGGCGSTTRRTLRLSGRRAKGLAGPRRQSA